MAVLARAFVCCALVFGPVSIGGCTAAAFTISIPDFVSKQVAGVWLWRWSPTTRTYQRDDQIVFGGREDGPTGEILDYVVAPVGGSAPLPFSTLLVRSPGNPDRVTLHLLFTRSQGPGSYRASTFNVTGDSPLSAEVLSF